MGRAAIGLSVRQLAAEAEVGVTTLSRFEAGEETVKHLTIEKIVAVFQDHGIEFSAGKGWVAVKATTE